MLLTAGTTLAGGGKGEEQTTNTSPGEASNTAQSSDDLSKPVELSVAVWDIQSGFDAPNAKNDTVYNDLTKKFNVTFKPVNVSWNDWQEKAKVWAASKQLPDMFADDIDTGMFQTWARQGVLKPLPDDLSPYPNLEKMMSNESVLPLKVDGKFYSIPRFGGEDIGDARLSRRIRYRKDWAEQAGFTKEPQSFEEFLAMTKAVMKQHPGIAGLTTRKATC